MSIFDTIFGGPTTTKTVDIPATQLKDMEATQKFRTDVALPYFQKGMGQLDTMYGINQPGQLAAAQNVAGTAGQVQETTGGVGESALRGGVDYMQSLFNPNYVANQVRLATAPGQQQYLQNIRQQGRQQAGSGVARGARAAMLNRMSANQFKGQQDMLGLQAAQQATRDQAGWANQLANIGYSGLDRALAASQAKQAAARAPMEDFGRYLGLKQQTVPASFYTPPYPGTQGSQTQTGADWKSILGGLVGLI